MRKIESLNNVRKTVLKLEKEISAISTNLSKVKHKDHTTMKKMINNINILLTKDNLDKSLYKNDPKIDNEENKNTDEENHMTNKSHKSSHYNYNSVRNIDYLLLLNNRHKTKNNYTENKTGLNKSYFNKKCASSSKIGINNTQKEQDLLYDYNMNIGTGISRNENIKNSVRNKLIEYPIDDNLNKSNQNQYLKPKLVTQYSNRNSSYYINKKNNTSIKNDKEMIDQLKNEKYLTLDGKMNKGNNVPKSILNSLYYENQNCDTDENDKNNITNHTNNFLNEKKNKNKNKSAFSYEKKEPEFLELRKNKEFTFDAKDNDSKVGSEKEILSKVKKNKKLILEKKVKKNHENLSIQDILNQNNFNSNTSYQYSSNYYNNIYQNINNIKKQNYKKIPCLTFDNEDMNRINISENLIKNETGKYIYPYRNQDISKANNENQSYYNQDKYFNTFANFKTQRKIKDNRQSQNNQIINNKTYSKSLNPKNNYDINKEKENEKNIDTDINTNYNINKVNEILKLLNANSINDAILKLKNLKNMEKGINKLKGMYLNKNNNTNKKDKLNNLTWISNILKSNKINESYKNFCQNIIIQYELKNFNNFKSFINNLLPKLPKNIINNNIYLRDIESLSSEDNYCSNNYDDMNSKKYINNYINEINTLNSKENINDMDFSNHNNYKIINEYMNSHY